MAATRPRTKATKVKDPVPGEEAPADQPIPAQPSPRPKDAPLTMREVRLSREGKRPSRAKPVENVLREGLRLERVPDPSILVLFGATGDLAHRKVIPALYQLWRNNLLPHEFILLAIGRRPYEDETFRAEIRTSLEQYSRILPLDKEAWESFAERITYQQLDFDDAAAFDTLSTHLDAIDAEHGTRGNRLYYLATQPIAVRRDRGPAGTRRPRPRAPRRGLAADRHREAVRARPGLGQAAQPRGRQGLPRVAGLSHRPLPGQGDRPQPAGLPVRQRDLRAALEPALRRPRADHRRGVDRDREPGRVLRTDRRLARRPPEPPPPARQPGRDGAAGDVRGECPARREGQGPARDRDHARRRPRRTSSAANTVRAGSPRPRSRAIATSPTSTPSRRPRRSSRPS